MKAQTLDTYVGDNKLISFVKRLTECNDFPYLNKISAIVESNQVLLEFLTGAVSAVYSAGTHKRRINYDEFGYFSDLLQTEEMNTFLGAVYEKARE